MSNIRSFGWTARSVVPVIKLAKIAFAIAIASSVVGRAVLHSIQIINAVQQHARCPAVVLIVVEDALAYVGIASLDPAVKPFDGSGAGGVRVAPLKAEIRRQRLERKIPRRPLGRLLHNIVVEVDRVRWVEQLFDLLAAANFGILLLQLAVNGALVF